MTGEFHIDGPLVPVEQSRAETIARMAADLLALDAFHNEHDARLTLRVKRYTAFDVEALMESAIYQAKQHAIAREISGS